MPCCSARSDPQHGKAHRLRQLPRSWHHAPDRHQPSLENALVAQGLDWTTFTRQEMRTVVCGNCHVEYYFEGDDKLLIFPWANGTRIEQIIYAYYTEEDFTDWTHP